MESSMLSGATTKLKGEKLPLHMRRKVISHNSKKLPRHVREIHLNQMKKSGSPPKQKMPSRRQRRKSSYLLNEYNRRQSKIKRLNTHIWHAKRFHMIEKWGYKLPYRLRDKSFTACYRVCRDNCLLQDISYFQCLEINGNKDYIVQEFNKITNENENLPIGSEALISGFREGKTTLYQYGSSLRKPLGVVEFLWRYCECGTTSIEKTPASLWLWIHPAIYEEVLKTLVSCFNLIKGEREHYFNNTKNVQLKDLKTELNRFRLSGKLANQILHNCFTVFSNEKFLPEELKNFFKSTNDTMRNQMRNWNQLKCMNVNIMPPHIILPIIIQDPRLNTLQRRNELKQTFVINVLPHQRVFTSADSPLWEENLRKTVNSNKVSEHEIAKLKSTLLVPVDFRNKGYPIPIILIHKPGNICVYGFASSWDIILPSSWAQPIWISLIMTGARPGGLREYKHINFEMSKPDLFYPDTSGGEMEEQRVSEYYIKTYFRKTPKTRTNFNKLKIVSPFKFNWRLLINNWSCNTIDNFMVLRDRNMLIDLQKCITLGKSDIYLPNNCLIPVQIECKKGIPKRFALICIPNKGDLVKLPVETIYDDPNEKTREKLRSLHKGLLKNLRLHRKKAKRLGKAIKPMKLLLSYTKQMRELWLPDVYNIKNSCSRQVLGFVKEGGFSYTFGSKGIGYIAGAAVNALINSGSKDQVLIRNTHSVQYYLTKLTVITDL